MPILRIAVLITCHNRQNTTLASLGSLFRQELPKNIIFEVYLVDDGSTDGTGDAVKKQFPSVHVIKGNGNLYWGGGMRLAWSAAMKEDRDFYLWLNDDTTLILNAMATLLATYAEVRKSDTSCGIIVGSACDPDTGQMTYGGYKDINELSAVIPTDHPQPCTCSNGNVVLIDKVVVAAVGNLSQEFQHTSADLDYGLRAKQKGFSLWVAPGYQGYCKKNSCATWCDPNKPLTARWKALHGPKGQPPHEKVVFARRHLSFWPLVLVKLYLKALFPRQWKSLKRHFGKA
jgi:GT2 family glycosyltransferase